MTAAATNPGAKLERSTALVLANTAVTGGLGTLFWIVAAALFDPVTVAASVAASSLLIALSFLAQANLATGFSRFLPPAGSAQRSTVRRCYRFAIACSTVASLGLLVIGLARGGSIVAGGDLSLTIVTAASIPVWVVFALQDGALVASRRASWLPIENGVTTIAKIALLPALLMLPGQSAVLLAWTIPAVPAILIVNRALFGRILHQGDDPADIRPLLRFARTDLFGAAATMLSLRVVPLIVVEWIGGDLAAHVSVPWSIVTVAALALTAVSRLVLAEMSHAPDEADAVARRTTRVVLMIFIPSAIVGAIAAYPALMLAGGGYARNGAPVLIAGVLGLIPAAIFECRLARYRFDGRLATVTGLQALRAMLLLGSVIGVIAAGRPELIGVGFAVSNAVVLVAVRKS